MEHIVAECRVALRTNNSLSLLQNDAKAVVDFCYLIFFMAFTAHEHN